MDLFVYDGLHTAENMLFEMRAVWPHLSGDGLLVSDDVDNNDAVSRFSNEVAVDALLICEPGKDGDVAVMARG